MKDCNERFWSKVKHSRGCWEWAASKNRQGYGSFRLGDKSCLAHRLAFMLAKRSMFDPSLCVLHSCDNPACVRPGHLYQGTDLDNARDRDAKGRRVPLRGEVHGAAKLTAMQVLAIRDDPRVAWRIAAEYSVSIGAIHHIKARISWKHL